MQTIRLITLLLFWVMALLGCTENNANAENILVETEDIEVVELLKKELDAKSIWYNVKSETALNVKPEAAENVIRLLNNIGKHALPEGRHASFPDDVYAKVVDKLTTQQIPFQIVDALSSKWIVWAEEDTDKVITVIDSVTLPSINIEQ